MTTNGSLKAYRKAIIAVSQAIEELGDIPTADLPLSTLGERQDQFKKLHEVKWQLEYRALQIQKGGDAA